MRARSEFGSLSYLIPNVSLNDKEDIFEPNAFNIPKYWLSTYYRKSTLLINSNFFLRSLSLSKFAFNPGLFAS